MNLTTYKNNLFEVAITLENNEVMFDAGLIARNLGFVKTETKNGKQYTSVRWSRVNRYLGEVGFDHQVGEGDLIPESIVYLLAFKGETKIAIDFQKWLAIEVIPSIRKEGGYVNHQPTYTLPQNFKEALLMLAETVDKNEQLKAEIESNKEKVVLANAITTSDEGLLIEAAAKYMRQNGVNIGRDRLFGWLRGQGYLVSRKGREWNMPTQKSLNKGLMKIHCHLYYDSEGELKTNRQVVVTGKGLLFFINKFLHDGQLKLSI